MVTKKKLSKKPWQKAFLHRKKKKHPKHPKKTSQQKYSCSDLGGPWESLEVLLSAASQEQDNSDRQRQELRLRRRVELGAVKGAWFYIEMFWGLGFSNLYVFVLNVFLVVFCGFPRVCSRVFEGISQVLWVVLSRFVVLI